MQIDGAVVVVTGASSGIGAATARAAVSRGAHVVLAARREQRITALAQELSGGRGRVLPVRADVTDPVQVDALVRSAVEAFGRVDVVVNNAGQGLQASVEQVAVDDVRALLELNLIAPLRLMQAVLPGMRARRAGSIVNVSSGTTLADAPGTGAYVASKIALERLSAIARVELDESGVSVSTVIPFATRSEFIDSLRVGSEQARAEMAAVDFDTPEQVADVILGLVMSGAARADLVPATFGGSRR